MYSLHGIFRVPCRFNLTKYPFADQQCEINMWLETPIKEEIVFSRLSNNYTNNDVTFDGRNDVGEYLVKNTINVEKESNHSVSLIIQLESLYGYHLLNSFMTSLLIVLIAYACFFFPVNDFNDRIMVSLTSLLVLTALLTSAGETSIQTPYLKLLDIWYAVLMFFNFLIVVVMTVLDFMQHRMNRDWDRDNQDIVNKQLRANWLNRLAFILLIVAFSIFLVTYVLIASEAL